jgi:two-component system chemotaxis response regulator CheB
MTDRELVVAACARLRADSLELVEAARALRAACNERRAVRLSGGEALGFGTGVPDGGPHEDQLGARSLRFATSEPRAGRVTSTTCAGGASAMPELVGSGRTLGWDPSAAVVALVCSAGGVEALGEVLAHLPTDFDATVIALQHLRPDRPSRLAAILARSSRLPVAAARNRTVLRPGTVLVVPPGKHALATNDDRLALVSSSGPSSYRPSADLLLSSLAVVAARRSIAVILSGGGHDGATGARAIRSLGGIVIACDEESAQHFGMPAAAIGRDDAVDYVLPLTEIAAALVELVEHRVPRAAPPPDTSGG